LQQLIDRDPVQRRFWLYVLKFQNHDFSVWRFNYELELQFFCWFELKLFFLSSNKFTQYKKIMRNKIIKNKKIYN